MPLESKEVIVWAEFSHSLSFPLLLSHSDPIYISLYPLSSPLSLPVACSSCRVFARVSLSLSVHWLNVNLKRAVWLWPSNFSALCFSFPIFIIGNIITPCRGTLSIARKSFIKENALNQWWAVSPTLCFRPGGWGKIKSRHHRPPSDATEPMWVNGLLTLASLLSVWFNLEIS